MTTYECLTLVVGFLTLLVLSWTLFVLRGYAKDTKTLASTAVEQLPRPCVVLKRSADPGDLAVLEGEAASLMGDNQYASPLIFMNVGTGPAVNCRYRISRTGDTQRGEPSFHLVEIGPSASFEAPHRVNTLSDHAVISIEYESVAGSPYQTDITIEDRKWVRDTRFISRTNG